MRKKFCRKGGRTRRILRSEIFEAGRFHFRLCQLTETVIEARKCGAIKESRKQQCMRGTCRETEQRDARASSPTKVITDVVHSMRRTVLWRAFR